MRSALILAGALLLASCSRDNDAPIEAVPEPNAETANALMAEAERAAANAQERMDREGPVTHTNQGEAR